MFHPPSLWCGVWGYFHVSPLEPIASSLRAYSCLQVSRSLHAPSVNPSLDLALSFFARNSQHHYRWKLVDLICINWLLVPASYNPLEPIPLIVLLKGPFCLSQGVTGFRSLVFGNWQGSPEPVLLAISLPDILIKLKICLFQSCFGTIGKA